MTQAAKRRPAPSGVIECEGRKRDTMSDTPPEHGQTPGGRTFSKSALARRLAGFG
jgi:hypothetical protein